MSNIFMKYLQLVKISYWRKERIKCDILPKNIKKRERERERERGSDTKSNPIE